MTISIQRIFIMPRKSSRGSRRSRGSRGSRGSRSGGKKTRIVRKKPRAAPRTDKLNIQGLSLIDLQRIARSHGIPFGGISKTHLIEKILAYQL